MTSLLASAPRLALAGAFLACAPLSAAAQPSAGAPVVPRSGAVPGVGSGSLQLRSTADDAPSKVLLTPEDLAIGGAFALGALAVAPADERIARWAQAPARQGNGALARTAVIARRAAVPGALVLPALWAAGRLAGNDRLAALGLHATEAVAIGLGSTAVLKGVAGRQRPYVEPRDASSWKLGRGWRRTEYASFPSGHATIAFAAASAVSGELKDWRPDVRQWLAPLLHAGAVVVGASRVYDDRHWASDVVAGSGIGLLAGRATVRWHQSHPDNRIDGWLLAGSLVPSAGGGARLSLAILPR